MLVSTKYLGLAGVIARTDHVRTDHCSYGSTLVKLVARPRRSPTQAHPFAQSCQGASPRTIVALTLAQDLLQTSGQHRANGGAFLRSKDANFTQQSSIKFQSDIGFHRRRLAQIYVQHKYTCSQACRQSQVSE